MAVRPIPEGFHTITPYLVVHGVAELLGFLARAFDAKEFERLERPDGGVMHAQVRIGDSMVMMGEAHGEWQPAPCSLYMYVEDVDAVYRRAVDAGGTSVEQPTDQFYGDRHGAVKDPSGNIWWIATHQEDVPPEEIARRAAEMAKSASS